MTLEALADMYAPAILAAVADLQPWTALTPEEYALQAALALLTRMELYGVSSVNHYLLHRRTVQDDAVARAVTAYTGGRL